MLVNRDVGSMSSAVRRLSDRMVNDPQLVIQIEKLKAVFETNLASWKPDPGGVSQIEKLKAVFETNLASWKPDPGGV